MRMHMSMHTYMCGILLVDVWFTKIWHGIWPPDFTVVRDTSCAPRGWVCDVTPAVRPCRVNKTRSGFTAGSPLFLIPAVKSHPLRLVLPNPASLRQWECFPAAWGGLHVCLFVPFFVAVFSHVVAGPSGQAAPQRAFTSSLCLKGTSAGQPSPPPLLTGWREALSCHGCQSRRGIISGWRASKAAAASGSLHTWQPRLPSSLLSLLSH